MDWYGDREPFIDKATGLLQLEAAEQNFSIAMMYDETRQGVVAATDDALVAFDSFHEKYLNPAIAGSQAYLYIQKGSRGELHLSQGKPYRLGAGYGPR